MLKDEHIKELSKKGLTKLLTKGLYFKYINFSDGNKYILKQNTLKFNQPEKFNDPFDCNEMLMEINISEEDENKIINELCVKHNMSFDAIKSLKRNMGGENPYQQALQNKKKDFTVSCFSEDETEVLMWSHYADKHTGMCIGFDLEFMCDDYVFYPINYINIMEPIDGMASTTNVFYYWLTIKSARWQYEKEIRAINNKGRQIIPFEKNAIKEIIFGCRVNASKISFVIKRLTKSGYENVRFFKMEVDTKTFLLMKTPISV